MHTGSDEKSPYACRDAKIPVCIRGLVSIRSPYAYRDCANPRMHTGIKINPRMHTGITYKSPYAYWDYMTCNPRMHTGIDLDHRMHTGIFAIPVCIRGLNLIPVCIRGSHVCNPLMHTGIKMQSPYAYGDLRDPRMHLSSFTAPFTAAMAVIVVNVGSGDGRLRPLWSLLTEAAVGWSRRRQSSSLTAAAKTPLPPQPSTAATFDNDRHRRRR